MAFQEQVVRLLDETLGQKAFVVVNHEAFPEHNCALVDVQVFGVRLRFVEEHGWDYWIDIASLDAPDQEYSLKELLLAESAGPVEREMLLVSHDATELGDVVRAFAARHDQLVALLAPERISDTKSRLQEIHRKAMHPELRKLMK